MTRLDKLKKLSNAVREYRGVTYSPVGSKKVEWTHPPRKAELPRVRSWLGRLGVVDVDAAVEKIDGFKSYDEYYDWVKGL